MTRVIFIGKYCYQVTIINKKKTLFLVFQFYITVVVIIIRV